MNPYLVALLWAIVGAAAGYGVRRGSVVLARLEELEPGGRWWQEYGPPVATAVVFGVFGYAINEFPILLVRSVFVLVLVQVIFFDFEFHLILDRVLFPAMGFALVTALAGKPWWPGGEFLGRPLVDGTPIVDALAMGVGAGALFLFIAFVGSMLFRTEALGFGDVKFAVLMGLTLGWPFTFTALFYGVLLAAVGAFVYIVTHRSMKGTIAYGPYLAAGAILVLLQWR